MKPANIIGAIANEAGLDAADIGRIDIEETVSFVDLPVGMPKEIFLHLKKVWVAGQQLRISLVRDEDTTDGAGKSGRSGNKPPKKREKKPGKKPKKRAPKSSQGRKKQK